MPTATGAWAPNSSTNQRMRLIIEWSVPTPSPGQTSITITGTVKVGAYYGFYDNVTNRLTVGGTLGVSFGPAVRNINVATNGTQTLYSFSRSVSLGSSAVTRTITASLTGVHYIGQSVKASVTANVTIPARVAVPTPTGVTITRVSPTRVRITWGGGAAHDVQIRRRTQAGSSTAAWNYYERPGTLGAAVNSGVEYNVIPGYEWSAAVRRQAGGVWSSFGYSSGVARLFNGPLAPSITSVVNDADNPNNRRTVSWTYSGDNTRPVVKFDIAKYQEWSGEWRIVASVPGNARSWVDTGTHPNDLLRYQVIAENAAGRSASATYGPIRTTPAAPVNVEATRTGPAAALITWERRDNAATGQTIQAQTSSDLGATWSDWADLAGHINFTETVESRSLSDLNAALWYRFRVVAVAANSAPNATLYGYSSATDIIRPAAPPNAPTLRAPSGVASTAESVEFRWQHNPTDGSAQTAYELQYRLASESTWTTLSGTSTSASSRFVQITYVGTYEFRVRTKGQHADWSPYSQIGVFEVLNPPSLTIISPQQDEAWPSNRADISLDFNDDTGAAMTSWRAELHSLDGMGGGELIETRTGSSAIDVIRFNTELRNFANYGVFVWATSGTGLESLPASVEFTTDFLPPTPPTLTGEWVEQEGLARLAVQNLPAESYEWLGEPYNSASTRTVDGVTITNLALNPTAAVGSGGWLSSSSVLFSATKVDDYSRRDGVSSVRVERLGVSPSRAVASIYGVGASSIVSKGEGVIAISPGSHTFSVYATTNIDSWGVDLYVSTHDSSGVVLQSFNSEIQASGVGPNEWARFSISFEAPAGAEYIRVTASIYGPLGYKSTGEEVSYFTDALVTQTDHLVDYFDGNSQPTVDTVYNRIERSLDLGATWEPIADNMPLDVGLEDDMVPLNTRVWYRAVAVSGWDTEAYSEILELDTTTDKLWLMTMGSGVKVALECGLQLEPTFEQERISEQYYGRPWPYSHYGEHRLVRVAVSATWAIGGIPCSDGIGTANDPHDLFGQDLWYRDPAGRAFRAGFTSGITLAQDNHWVQTVGFTVERVQV